MYLVQTLNIINYMSFLVSATKWEYFGVGIGNVGPLRDPTRVSQVLTRLC